MRLRWPWTLETRDSYTDQVVSALVQAATSGRAASPLVTGAVEIAAGFYGRAFASATVNDPTLSRVLTPVVLSSIARSLIRHGASLHVIGSGGRGLQLQPIGHWDIHGARPDPASWRYQITEGVPDGSRSRLVLSAGVVHCVYASDPARPFAGRSPLGSASATGTLTSHVERALSEEVSGPVGSVIPVPTGSTRAGDATVDPYAKLKSDLVNLRGGLAIVETTASGAGDRGNAPHSDWLTKSVSPRVNQAMIELRQAVLLSVLSVCGIPLSLAALPADGVAAREGWRRFLFGSVIPVSRLILSELRIKFDSPDLDLNFDDLQAVDLVARARAVGGLVKAGVETDDAMEIAGLSP